MELVRKHNDLCIEAKYFGDARVNAEDFYGPIW